MPNSKIRKLLMGTTSLWWVVFYLEDEERFMPVSMMNPELLMEMVEDPLFKAYGPPPLHLNKGKGLNLSAPKRTGVRGNR